MASAPPHPSMCVWDRSRCPVVLSCVVSSETGPAALVHDTYLCPTTQPPLSPTVQGPESLCLPPGSHSHHWSHRVHGPWNACGHLCPWEPGTGADPLPWTKPASSFRALQPRDAQHPALLPRASGGGCLPAVQTRWAGLGASQGRSAWTQFSSRMSGDWNSWPRRYASRPSPE